MRDFSRNPETRNTLVRVLSNIWRLEQVRNTKLAMDVSNEKSLKVANSRSTAFTVRELLKEKQLGGVRIVPAHRLELIMSLTRKFWEILSNTPPKNPVRFPICYAISDTPTCTDLIIGNKLRSMLIFLKLL